MSRCKEYQPEQGYKYQILVRTKEQRAFEHLDYAVDRKDKDFLLKEYRLVYRSEGEFKTILLPKKYHTPQPDRQGGDQK